MPVTVTALTDYDLITVFIHVFPMLPAPLILLAAGTALLSAPVLPRVFGYLALVLGAAYVVVGLAGLFTTPLLTLVVGSQSVRVLAAAITLLLRPPVSLVRG
jgi:hypothetical protein